MRIVKLAFWYMWRSFINGLKRAYKVLLVIIAIVAVFAAIIGGISYFMPDELMDEEIEEEEEDYEINPSFDIVDGEDGTLILYLDGEAHDVTLFLAEAIAALVALFVFVGAIWKGAKTGAAIFEMPDVNFLFPAPLKPQSVLLFRLIGQIGTTLLGSTYIIWQMPNMISNGLPVAAAVCIVIAFLVLSVVAKFISVLAYVLLSKHERMKELIGKHGYALFAVPFLVVGFLYYVMKMPLYDSIFGVFGSTASRCVPFWGWLKAFTAHAICGQYGMAAIYMLLTVLGSVLLIWLTWRIDVDFYEDAIEAASAQALQMEQVQQAAEAGSSFGVKHEGKRQEKIWNRIRNRVMTFEGYEGGKVFFYKTLQNRKRFYKLFGLCSPTCSMYLGLAAGCTLTFRFIGEIQSVLPIVVVIFAFMFFRSFLNPMAQEMQHNFIYMIPERPFSLLGWGMLGQVADGAIDLFPAMIVSFFVGTNIIDTIAWFGVLLSAHMFFGMIALMVDLVVSSYLPKAITGLLQMLLRFIPFIPTAIILLLGTVADSMLLPLLMIILINAVASLLVFLPCPYHLHKGKK